MYRRKRAKEGGGPLDLDSLMDILSDLVAVIVFIVMYAIMEIGSQAYQAEVVVSPEPTAGSQRVVVVCEAGTVRVLDVRPALRELLNGYEIVQSVGEIERFIASNQRVPTDDHFRYSLLHEFRPTTDFYAMLDLEIEELPGTVGDSIQQLASSSYAAALRELDPRQVWLAFAVDTASIDVFRQAREMAIAAGFATGFDLLSLDFPLRVALSEDGMDDLLSPLNTISKPQR
ncbi:MAG: hypothetical protein AB7T31_04060 [Gemmatimonadales bacterium]